MEISDEQLIYDYLGGDERVLEILIGRYIRPIYSFVYRYAGKAIDAEEITQETFVKVWRNLKKFDQERSFKTWIFSIAKNTTLDFLRKKKAIPFSRFDNEENDDTFSETIVDPSPLPDELLEKKGLGKILAYAIEGLSPKYRTVLFLRFNDHFTFREISEALGEPLDTVKSRYRRAIILLKKILSESGEPK